MSGDQNSIRAQLMELAGLTDPADFDRLVRELAPHALASANGKDKNNGEMVGIGATERANLVRIGCGLTISLHTVRSFITSFVFCHFRIALSNCTFSA